MAKLQTLLNWKNSAALIILLVYPFFYGFMTKGSSSDGWAEKVCLFMSFQGKRSGNMAPQGRMHPLTRSDQALQHLSMSKNNKRTTQHQSL